MRERERGETLLYRLSHLWLNIGVTGVFILNHNRLCMVIWLYDYFIWLYGYLVIVVILVVVYYDYLVIGNLY